jgi:fatty-acyl-CoA synthase
LIEAIPLTGVGKIFKPALRWDAAARKLTQMLADLHRPGVQFAVTVAAHPVHGSLATVRVQGAAGVDRPAVEAAVRERLAPLALQHEIEWS